MTESETVEPIANETPAALLTQDPEKRAYLRSFSFYRPQDLHVYKAENQPGDDGRADLATAEIVIFSLLANRSHAAERRVYGFDKPVRCVTHSRQPLTTVAWDRGSGMFPWITDGRQRGRDSNQLDSDNPGAIEAINLRTNQLVTLALEIAAKDSEAASKPDMLRIKTRNEALARNKRGEAGWSWARPIVIPLYVGELGEKMGMQAPGLIDWKPCISNDPREPGWVSQPTPILYVAWVAFEPEDRDPGTCLTQLASFALKGAQVANPPTIQAKQYLSLCGERPPAKVDGETDEAYEARCKAGGPYGQGLPIPFVAEHFGVDRNWVYFYMAILQLEPEVQEALDANARGEEGLSLNQVRTGGFFISTTGRAGNDRLPKSRAEQLKLLDELRGKRGIRSLGESNRESVGAGKAESEDGGGSGGSEGMNDPSRRREVSGEDSSLARHRADEPRAGVGPDSPSTAGDAPKAARLDGSLFLAMRERFNDTCELYTAGSNGLLPNGEEPSADSLMLQRLHDGLYHFASYLAGDMTALTSTEDDTPIVRKFREEAKDAIDQVLRARGLMIRPNTGAVATGVPVLPVGDRKPVELVKTPRKGGEVLVAGTAGAGAGAESVSGTTPPSAADKSATEVSEGSTGGKAAKGKAPKAAKPAKPKKVRRSGPFKPKTAKSAKAPKKSTDKPAT